MRPSGMLRTVRRPAALAPAAILFVGLSTGFTACRATGTASACPATARDRTSAPGRTGTALKKGAYVVTSSRRFQVVRNLPVSRRRKDPEREVSRNRKRPRKRKERAGGRVPSPRFLLRGGQTERTGCPDERLGSRRSPPDSGDRIRGTLPALSSAGRSRGKRGGAIALPVRPDGPGGGLPQRRDAGGSGRGQASGGGPHDSP